MTTIIVLVAAALGVIIFLARDTSTPEVKRRRYLQSLAEHLESSVEPIDGKDNSFKIHFQHQGQDFIFEDMEDYKLEKEIFYKGYLRLKSRKGLMLSFTERPRTQFRSDADSLSDMISPWSNKPQKVHLPKGLADFNVYTNNPDLVNRLLEDPAVVDAFVKSKDSSSRGSPVMSLEVMDGSIVLRFHEGNLHPQLDDIRYNPSSIDQYTNRLLAIQRRSSEIEG